MSFTTWLRALRPASRPVVRPRRTTARLGVELLEDRSLLSATLAADSSELWNSPAVTLEGDQLFLGNFDRDSVPRYDATTGEFIDTFASRGSGGLNQPYGVIFGPDGDLYVSTGEWGGQNQIKAVLRFDGATGAFIENFTKGGDLKSPRGIIFGPDGDLYVADRNVPAQEGRVARYDGVTGAFLGDFVPLLSGGLKQPTGLVFGPKVGDPGKFDLYVCNQVEQNVLRFDGETGVFLGQFASSGSGGLQSPGGVTFGPDGNMYVTATSYISRTPAVLRYHGPNTATPGAFLDAFVSSYSDGKRLPFGLIFGPDGNHDGHQDLYVTDAEINSALNGNKGSVRRFDGLTGALIDTFIPEQSEGMRNVGYITFTRTDSVTLAYHDATPSGAAALRFASSAAPATPIANVNGGGQATLTDPDGNAFPFTFSLGSTTVNFNFGPAFSQVWGAMPGVDAIHLTGRITQIAVADDGTITLSGQLTEKDYVRGDGVAFVEENVPFTIIVSADLTTFTLQWCELPTFDVQLTNASLH